MTRLTFGSQLRLLTLLSLAILALAILASLSQITFPAFKEEFRSTLSSHGFEQMRRQRCLDLGHIVRLSATDGRFVMAFNRSLREFQPYVEELGQLPPAQLKKPSAETRGRLEAIRRFVGLGNLEDPAERLFMRVDNTPPGVPVETCADLFLLVDVNGVVLCELATGSVSGNQGYGKYSRGGNNAPEELTFFGNPLADAGLQNVDHEKNQAVAGYFRYGGKLYQGVAGDLPQGTGMVVMADRLDGRLATGVADSLASPDSQNSEERNPALIADGVHQLVASSPGQWGAVPDRLTWQSGMGQINFQGEQWQTSLTPLDSTPRSLPEYEPLGPMGSPVGWLVLLKPTRALDRLANHQYLLTCGLIALVTLAVILVSSVVSGYMGRPIELLARGLAEVGQGNLYTYIKPEGPSEVRAAAEAFNRMVEGLKDKDTLEKLLARLEQLRKKVDLSDEHVRQQTQFGSWVVVGRLGAGGMASVYKALPLEGLKETDRVAIKVIHKHFAADPEFQARFQREYRVLENLVHPGIVTVLEGGDLNGILYIVMEFVDGIPLNERLRNGPLALAEFLALAEQMLAALHYAHGHQVIHRDLKPDNFMLDSRGRIKVMDFGLAGGKDMSRLTMTGDAMGTPAYMSPEQVLGAVPDALVDQYGLGIVFYEMLTGRRPFEATDLGGFVHQHLTVDPPDPCQFRPDLPVAWGVILLRMLSKKREERFADLLEVEAAFRAGRCPGPAWGTGNS